MDTCCSLQTFLDAALALELTTLPPGDVRSAGFFHGRLGRLAAEALLTENGHFLVRESSSSSERQYVLSCRSTVSTEIGSQSPLPVALHFLIHEWPEKNEERKVQYAFDGDKFESIQALINYHVTMKAPVTSTSGAIISRPVERRRPLNQKQLEQYYQNRPNWSLSRLLKDVDVLLKVEETNLKETTSSLLDQNNLVDNNFAAFSSEYLRQLQSGISAISLEDSLLSSGGSSSSSTDLKSYQSALPIGDLLAYSSANLLATHLFKRNLLFFGLDFENFGSSLNSDIQSTNTTLSTPPSPPLHCALELLCLPGIGRQFRRDAIVRHETLKYFVVLSILRSGQENQEDTQAQIYLLRKWLQVTEKLLLSLGDHFAFGAIMAGLRHPAIASLERLWTALRSSGVASTEALLYDTIFSSQFKSLQGGALLEQNSRSMVLPFVVQLCHLMECSAIVGGRVMPLVQNENGSSLEEIIAVEASSHQKVGLMDFSLDSILAHIELSAALLDRLPSMEKEAVERFSGCFFREPALEELFKTTTLLRYLFGPETDFDPSRQQISHEVFRRLEQQLLNNNGSSNKSTPFHSDYQQLPHNLPSSIV